MFCRRCGGSGTYEGCPVCGKIKDQTEKQIVLTETVVESQLIPKEYLGVEWDIQKLIHNHQELVEDEHFKRYSSQLKKIHEIFSRGEVPNKSAIILANRGMSKITFAYSCMQLALQYGHKVCRLIDNTQLKRINVLSSDNPNSWILRELPSIEEIETSDVLFLTIDKDNYGTALRTIESIMEKRARYEKSTFIISRYSLDKMSQFEKKNSYYSLMDYTGLNNPRKYPVIINGLI